LAKQVGVQYPTQIWDEELGLSTSFCVVVAGEYNAGKSTLINALLGNSQLLPMGVLPTTDSITILSSGSSSSSSSLISSPEQHDLHQPPQEPQNTTIVLENETATRTANSSKSLNVIHYRLQNVPLLQDLTLIDTPGTNAIFTDHGNLTMQLLPSADVILFVTAADRPFSESERRMLESISKFRKSIVVIINKIDVLEQAGGDHGQSDKERVEDFVVEHVSSLLGARPIVLSVSARLALAAKQFTNDDSSSSSSLLSSSSSWRRSNFQALEHFLEHTLTVPTKIQAKLSSPVGVTQNVLTNVESEVQKQHEKLKNDLAILHLLQIQLDGWRRELDSDMEQAAQTLSDILTREGKRGHIFLQRLNNSIFEVYHLFCMESSDRVLLLFEHTKPISVISSSSSSTSARGELASCCRDISDQMATRGRAQGQCMIEVLGAAAANSPSSSLVGSVVAASRFEETRTNLETHMLQAVTRNVDSDITLEREEQSFLDRLKRSVWLSLGLNLSSLVVVFATTVHIVDVTMGLGVSACLFVAGVSSFTMRTRQIADQYEEIWKTRSQRLDEDIRVICAREADRVERRIAAAVAPYTRRIESEQVRIDKLARSCDELSSVAQRLRKQISYCR
jgi:GTPase Era involved in 16S rRNA processing